MWTATAARPNPPGPDAVLPTRPVHCDFRRYGRPPGAGAWPPGADGPGYPPPSGGIHGRLVPVPLSRMAGSPFPVTPPRPGPVPRLGASVQVSAVAAERSPSATSAPGQSHVPLPPGAAWCSGCGTDPTWQDRTRPPSPRRPGERGMRNGNVPRRSTHPLEVFPRVQ
jgi:hypothetical protein